MHTSEPLYFLGLDEADFANAAIDVGTEHIQIYLSQNHSTSRADLREWKICCRYHPFCDDFGPMNMLSIVKFIESLDMEIATCCQRRLNKSVCRIEMGARALTNAIFLFGAYLILRLDFEPEKVQERFRELDNLVEGYRDATYLEPDFKLTLLDCWKGLHRGKKFGWVNLPKEPGSPVWGMIDIEAYAHYDDPLNADLHEVVPHKFVAFRGPTDLGGKEYVNDLKLLFREFAPEYYIDIFLEMGVSTVIRLNEDTYNGQVFEKRGIEHFDVYFDDCTCPTLEVIHRFFSIMSSAKGLVAIHCKAGLGRTGTLIALYLMRYHGFTAREAMGWLRIMRSGSVIGKQQRFLCEVEEMVAASCTDTCACRLSDRVGRCDCSSRDDGHTWLEALEERPKEAGSAPAECDGPAEAVVAAAQVSAAVGRRSSLKISLSG